MKKNLLPAFVSLLLIFCTFVVFGRGSSEDTAATASELKELKFSSYTATPGAVTHISEWPTQMAIMKAAEQYMGLKLEIEWVLLPQSEYSDRQQIYLASGQFHDVFNAGGNPAIIEQLGQAGQIVNLLDYQDQLRYYPAWLAKDPQNYNSLRAGFKNPEVWGFAYGQQSPDQGSQWLWAARLDVFQKHNIKIPENLDEMYNALKELKRLYPQSYPLESYVSAQWYSVPRLIMLINKVDFNIYFDGEKFIYGPLDQEERFKESIEYVRKLYQEKLLQPEFFTQTADELAAKALTDRTFVIPNAFLNPIIANYNNPAYPDVLWGAVSRPKGFDGQPGWKPNINRLGNNFINIYAHISSKTEHPALLVKLLDYSFSDEIIDFANWGIEGETYRINSDGKKEWLPVIMDLKGSARFQKLAEWGAIGSGFGYPSLSLPTILDWEPRATLWESPMVYDGSSYVKPRSTFQWSDAYDGTPSPDAYRPPVQLTKDELDLQTEIMTPLNTILEEGMIKLITGQWAFDRWNQYIAEVKRSGDYRKVVDIFNRHLGNLK